MLSHSIYLVIMSIVIHIPLYSRPEYVLTGLYVSRTDESLLQALYTKQAFIIVVHKYSEYCMRMYVQISSELRLFGKCQGRKTVHARSLCTYFFKCSCILVWMRVTEQVTGTLSLYVHSCHIDPCRLLVIHNGPASKHIPTSQSMS
jgi:hypothetical protein